MKISLFTNVLSQYNSISIRIIFNNIILLVCVSHFLVEYPAISIIFDWHNDPDLGFIFKVPLVIFLRSCV